MPALLSFPNFDSLFFVETDASSVSLGVKLAPKKMDGKVHPIEFVSPTMTDQERQYSTSEREALGVFFALTNFLVYLLSQKPLVI